MSFPCVILLNPLLTFAVGWFSHKPPNFDIPFQSDCLFWFFPVSWPRSRLCWVLLEEETVSVGCELLL